MEDGLLLNRPANKRMVDIPAIFCTIPSEQPSTKDLFRVYKDWSIIVIDAKSNPDMIWYKDFLAENDTSSHAGNQHVLTLSPIKPDVITKVIDLANVLTD